MPILNYTTKIAATTTVAEMQQYLGAHGARHVSIEYHNNQPVAVRFAALLGTSELWFRLPSNPLGVLRAMRKAHSIPARYVTEKQAERVSWRIVKDWCEAQFALIEAEQATLAQVFLPYAMVNQDTTLYEQFEQRGFPQLQEPQP